MPMMMSSMKALRTVEDKKAGVVDFEIPAPTESQILVEVEAVGQNPTDWKHVAYITSKDCGVGCDYAGTVVYDAHGYKKGDRVGGFVHGGAYRDAGAFAEFLVTDPAQTFRIPESVSFEAAAAFPIPYMTAALALYQSLKLSGPMEGKKSDDFVLIYGGSSAVGIQAIQLAALSGYRVITAASPKNFKLLESFGAEKCFDYKDAAEMARQIRDYTASACRYALDTISEAATVKATSESLASGAKLILLLPIDKQPREDVEIVNVLAYTCLGKAISYGPFNLPAVPENYEFSKTWWSVLTKLLEVGKLKEVPLKKMDGGLHGILDGFKYMQEGKVSAQKLVYKIKEGKQ